MAYSVEELINQSLRAAGLPLRVNDLYDGSDASKVGLELYNQARDELIDLRDWSFTSRTEALTLLKGPPPPGGYTPLAPWSTLYPIPGFLYEYAYPGDMLDLRGVIPPPGPMPDTDPVPAAWKVANDATPNVSGGVASGPPARVIYCNVANALAVYRAKVTNPQLFDTGFTASLVASLGKKFAVAFGSDVNVVNQRDSQAVGDANVASSVKG